MLCVLFLYFCCLLFSSSTFAIYNFSASSFAIPIERQEKKNSGKTGNSSNLYKWGYLTVIPLG